MKCKLVFWIMVVLLAGGSAWANPQDIVVVLLDDMGFSDFGCYGGEARTPNIDSLAAQGIRFRNFYNTGRCSPTRAALMTGDYSQQVSDKPGEMLPQLLTDNNVTMAEVLQDRGYRTYLAGKWHLGFGDRLPNKRGFEQVFGFGKTGGGSQADYWDAKDYKLISSGNEIAPRVYGSAPYEFYQTDALADYSIDFIDHHIGKKDDAPYLLYLAFHAPHLPLCAPKAVAEYTPPGGMSYLDIYSKGWDVVRQKRYERMLATGVIGKTYVLPPFSDAALNNPNHEILPIPKWDTLPADRRADLARRMAIYTAMVDRVDVAVGRIVDHLRETGRLDNTLIFILSDNGACSVGGVFGGSVIGHEPFTGERLAEMGQPFVDDNVGTGAGWANVANTPFRYYKRFNHEGGIHTPLIAYWPAGIKNPGRWSDQTGHLIDIMSTVVDVSGATFPTQYKGHAVLPMEGQSLVPVFNDAKTTASRQLGFEHATNRAWIDGHWKLVTKFFASADGSSPANALELYDLQSDPTETKNLADKYPERLGAMVEAWNKWAKRVGVPGDRLIEAPKTVR